MPIPARSAGGCCRVAARPATPLEDFGDAFATASYFAAAVLFWCATSSQLAGSHGAASRWAIAKSSTMQWVALKAHVTSACIEAKNLKREVSGSVNLCIDIKCSSIVSDFSAVLGAFCTTINLHFLSYKVTLSSWKKLAASKV